MFIKRVLCSHTAFNRSLSSAKAKSMGTQIIVYVNYVDYVDYVIDVIYVIDVNKT